jgi:gluconolactonase
VVSGLKFAEGPAADAKGNITFSDILGEEMLRLVPGPDGSYAVGAAATPFIRGSGGANGQMYTPDGRLLTCQMMTGKLQEVVCTGGACSLSPIVDLIDGVTLPGMNDLAIGADGTVWFSTMGNKKAIGSAGIYATTLAGGSARHVLTTEVQRPNGVRLSPDGKVLYVVSYAKPELWAFPVEGPAKLGAGRVLSALQKPDGTPAKGGDGLAVDSKGNVWVAVPEAKALHVVDAEGKTLGHVSFRENPSNCAFGGADGRTLFVTAQTSVYALPTLVEGHWLARGGPKAGPGAPADATAAPAAPAAPPPAPATPAAPR